MANCYRDGKKIKCTYKGIYDYCPLHSEEEEGFIMLDSLRFSDSHCPVCLDSIENDFVTFKCNHAVHIDCFKGLVQNSIHNCPICRSFIYENDVDSNASTQVWEEETPTEETPTEETPKKCFIRLILETMSGIRIYT